MGKCKDAISRNIISTEDNAFAPQSVAWLCHQGLYVTIFSQELLQAVSE